MCLILETLRYILAPVLGHLHAHRIQGHVQCGIETHLKLKSREISLVYNISWPFVSRFCLKYHSRAMYKILRSFQTGIPYCKGGGGGTIYGIWRHIAEGNIGSGSSLLPGDTKSLPEPLLTNYQWCFMAFTWGQFHWRCSMYLSLISVWKLLICDYNRNSQGPMS